MCAIAMTPRSRHASAGIPSLPGAYSTAVGSSTRRRAHSVPLRADNNGQQRCQRASTPFAADRICAGQGRRAPPSAVASQAEIANLDRSRARPESMSCRSNARHLGLTMPEDSLRPASREHGKFI